MQLAPENEGRRELPDQERTPEGRSLDQLAVGLADGTISRTKALKLIGASLLGGVGALVFADTAEARRRRRRRRGRCGRRCFLGRTVTGNTRCVRNNFSCTFANACDRNSECGSNELCITNAGCTIDGFRGVCITLC